MKNRVLLIALMSLLCLASTADQQLPVIVSDDVAKAYEASPAAADAKYKGIKVQLRGQTVSWGRDDGKNKYTGGYYYFSNGGASRKVKVYTDSVLAVNFDFVPNREITIRPMVCHGIVNGMIVFKSR